MKRNLKRNKPFWIDLIKSWDGKILRLGVYYKTFQLARKHARGGKIFKIDDGYIVIKSGEY